MQSEVMDCFATLAMNSPVIAKVAVIARSVSDVAIHAPCLVIARSTSDVAIRVIRRCRHHAHWCPRAASQVAISPVYLPMPVSSGVKLMP